MNYPNCADAIQYAEDVTAGDIPACKYVKLACKRFLDDLERADKGWLYHFDPDAAERACKFSELLPHVKGKWANKQQLMKLEPWQKFIKCNLFGWKNENGKRRFRESYKEIPRKNGKSFFAASDGLYMFAADGEFGAEVYSGATTEKQAWEVFRPALDMAKRTPELRDAFGIDCHAKNMAILNTGSRFEPIVGKPGDGASPTMWIVDEYHEHKDDHLYETGSTGMGAREQPLMYIITTAGSNTSGPCYEKRQDAIKVLEGNAVDEALFTIIYTVDEDDEWDSIDSLIKANPNYGVSVNPEYLERQLEVAKRSSSKQTAFKTKHLNMWVGARNQWMNMHAWALAGEALDLDNFENESCHIALDLASKKDIAHACILFKRDGKFYTFNRSWCPESALEDNDKYRSYETDGYLEVTPGNMIDYDYIKEEIISLHKRFNVQSLAFDPFQATYLITELQKYNIDCYEYQHIVKNMSEPMKEVEALVANGQLKHDNNTCMTWMMGNTVARLDAKDNIYPRKENDNDPKCKIDGAVSLIMAMGRWMANDEPDNPYEFRGLRTL